METMPDLKAEIESLRSQLHDATTAAAIYERRLQTNQFHDESLCPAWALRPTPCPLSLENCREEHHNA